MRNYLFGGFRKMKRSFAVIGMLFKIPTLLIFCTLFSISANATPVVWNLSGVTFDDGGTASGSFTYDEDTGIYSAISISTTAGSVINTAMDYNVTNATCLALSEIICFLNAADGPDYTNDLGLTLAWVGTPLTNAGGTVALTGAREYHCENANCATVDLTAPLRLLATGSITTGSVVPPPAPMVPTIPATSEWALILLIMSLCLMVFTNRKRLF